jgi:hypothetical protein
MKQRELEVMRRALKEAMINLLADGAEKVTQTDMVLFVLKRAMETLGQMRDPEAAWLYGQRTAWPEFGRTIEERFEAYEAELEARLQHNIVEDDRPRKGSADPTGIERMHIVFGSFPYLLVGRNRRRDYRFLCQFAGGKSCGDLAKKAGCHRQTVLDRVNVQLAAIAHRFKEIMPDPVDIAAAVDGLEADRLRRLQVTSGISGKSGI